MLVFWNTTPFPVPETLHVTGQTTKEPRWRASLVKRRHEQTWSHGRTWGCTLPVPSATRVRSIDKALTTSCQWTMHSVTSSSNQLLGQKRFFSFTNSLGLYQHPIELEDIDKIIDSWSPVCFKTWIFISFFIKCKLSLLHLPSKPTLYLFMSLLPLGFCITAHPGIIFSIWPIS